jgi:hypothetical protein
MNLFNTMIRDVLVGKKIVKCERSTKDDEGLFLVLDDGTTVQVSFVGGYGSTVVTDKDGLKTTLL